MIIREQESRRQIKEGIVLAHQCTYTYALSLPVNLHNW